MFGLYGCYDKESGIGGVVEESSERLVRVCCERLEVVSLPTLLRTMAGPGCCAMCCFERSGMVSHDLRAGHCCMFLIRDLEAIC